MDFFYIFLWIFNLQISIILAEDDFSILGAFNQKNTSSGRTHSCTAQSCPDLNNQELCARFTSGKITHEHIFNFWGNLRLCLKKSVCGVQYDPLVIKNMTFFISDLPDNQTFTCSIPPGGSLKLFGISSLQFRYNKKEVFSQQRSIFVLFGLKPTFEESTYECVGQNHDSLNLTVGKIQLPRVGTVKLISDDNEFRISDFTTWVPFQTIASDINIAGSASPFHQELLRDIVENYIRSSSLTSIIHHDIKTFITDTFTEVLRNCHVNKGTQPQVPPAETPLANGAVSDANQNAAAGMSLGVGSANNQNGQ